jgi:hypothetical protein
MKTLQPAGTGFAVAVAACLWACGGGSTGSPNPIGGPTPPPATPTPTPAPVASCGSPAPPPLYGFRLKVQNDQGYKKVLDSKPLVGKDAAYCASVGQAGDICVVRDEGAVDADGCNYAVVGIASQTGRPGPNWYWNDKPCRPANVGGEEPGCRLHPTNQFLVFAFGPGTYSACGDKDRVCHGIEIN